MHLDLIALIQKVIRENCEHQWVPIADTTDVICSKCGVRAMTLALNLNKQENTI